MSVIAPQNRWLILAPIMACSFMIAVETTIVSTAMPQIVGQLGDLHLYSWVFASFLLAQSAATVVFGKLADIYGRRRTLFIGMAIFLAGSVLCGLSWSMLSLVVFRLVQGAGAGAVSPVSITIVGDLYPAQERGKVQGYFASVWGVSSVLGPLAGGVIVQYLHWAWVFWINVPVGIAATIGFYGFLHERLEHHRRSVDVPGALLFTVAVSALIVALTEAGDGKTGTPLIASAVFAVALLAFVLQERRAAEPMIAFRLWGSRAMASVNGATMLSGMAMIGLTTFLPMYVQTILGRSALVAGLTLTATVLGWPISATYAARNFSRFGLRGTALIGAVLIPAGASAFVLLGPGMSPWIPGIGSFVLGLGMGFFSTAAIVIIQDSVDWTERGVATASNLFSRNLGSTLGAAMLGALLNWQLASGPTPVSAEHVRQLINHHATADAATTLALADALHLVFWGVFLLAAFTLVVGLAIPHVKLGTRPNTRELVDEAVLMEP
jgi:EmrB/QacA subfamily drug resistance transporter